VQVEGLTIAVLLVLVLLLRPLVVPTSELQVVRMAGIQTWCWGWLWWLQWLWWLSSGWKRRVEGSCNRGVFDGEELGGEGGFFRAEQRTLRVRGKKFLEVATDATQRRQVDRTSRHKVLHHI
jgi:hypothetical protein